MANYQKNLQIATNKLAKYFGLYTARDLAGGIALSAVNHIQGSTNEFSIVPPNNSIVELIAGIVDTSEGCLLTKDIISKFNNAITNTPVEEVNSFINFIEIYGPQDSEFIINSTPPVANNLNTILGKLEGINQSPNSPSKQNPNLSVFKVNHVRATPANKNINSSVVFLNGVPNLEIQKCVPYLDVRLIFPGSPVSDNGSLQNTSTFRFLEGNVNVYDGGSNSFRIAYALGTEETILTGSGGVVNQDPKFTSTGMDVFLSPQTLVNANNTNDESLRINPILDNFVPLMSLKSFEVEVAPSTGIMSFKTAKLSFTLHDRSRLAEIADLIRPDLYSRTELLIEYGWIHPEASSNSSITNHYAELINAMRAREKFGIVNSSLGMNDGGQVEITLDLAMRGAISANTEFISSDENGNVTRILDTIRDLEETIGIYRQRVFGQNQGAPSREIRGVQILDAAQDARNNLLLNADARNNLKAFRTQLSSRQSTPGSSANQLINSLNQLYGAATNGNQSNSGAAQQLRRSIQEQIGIKLVQLSTGTDPFIREPSIPNMGSTNQRIRPELRTLTGAVRQQQQTETRGPNIQAAQLQLGGQNGLQLPEGAPSVVSLGKLLSLFIGQPLAQSNRYDEVQILFYPFNQYAGLACGMNIASFAVNVRYFYEQYTRYRMENASRAANVTVRDFFSFLSSTIIDDLAAPSYGLFQTGLARHERQEGGIPSSTATGDSVQLQEGLERILRGVTPDGSFRMPQVDIYIETLPQRIVEQGVDQNISDGMSIMRVHIFDRQNTTYDTQNSLLTSARDNEITTISQINYQTDGGDAGVRQSQAQEASDILNAAEQIGIVEINPNASSDHPVYRVTGGTKKLKEFIMRTTPYIIYGAQGTTVKNANVSSMQDSQLSTVNMLRSFQSTNMEPNGELPGGLPLQIIPTEVNITCMGNPLIDFAQQFFIDFQTGTSIDNLYAVVGMSHKISAGEFSTDIKMAPLDSWGRYRSLTERVNAAAQELDRVQKTVDRQTTNPLTTETTTEPVQNNGNTPSPNGVSPS
jgi:hypothetical protein